MDPVTEIAFPGRAFFDAVYRGRAPWDIGAPQEDLLALVEAFPPSGTVLDLGCGTGDLVVGLAKVGVPAIGVDFAEAAVEEARARLGALPAPQRDLARVEVGDALHPSGWAGRIGATADCGFYHLFDRPTREGLVQEIALALPSGGRHYLLGFAVSFPVPDVPREVTEAEVRELFAPDAGWRLLALRPARFQTSGFEDVPALALCAERT